MLTPRCDAKRNKSDPDCLICQVSLEILRGFADLERVEIGYRAVGLRPEMYTLVARRLDDLRADVRLAFKHPHTGEEAQHQ